MSYPTIYSGRIIRDTGKLPEHDGLGTLSSLTSCKVQQSSGGLFTLEFTGPLSGYHMDAVVPDALIRANLDRMNLHFPTYRQFFRIVRTEKSFDSGTPVITATAEHLSYDLIYSFTAPMDYSTKDPDAALQQMLAKKFKAVEPFTFYNSIPVSNEYKHFYYGEPFTLRDGVMQIANLFGGSIRWDNMDVRLVVPDTTAAFTVSYGGNLADFSAAADSSGIITTGYVYYQSGDVYAGPVGPLTLYTDPYGTVHYGVYNCAEETDTEPDTSVMREMGMAWLRRQATMPSEELSAVITEVPAGQCPAVDDYVTIDNPIFGYRKTGRVVGITYDVLRDKYESIDIGEVPKDIAITIADLKRRGKG